MIYCDFIYNKSTKILKRGELTDSDVYYYDFTVIESEQVENVSCSK